MDHWAGGHRDFSDLFKTIVCSSRRVEISDWEAIELMLAWSRKKYERDVAGDIWFGETLFFHVLEGRVGAVDSLFAEIARDPRHGDIRVLDDGVSTRRYFRECETHVFQGPEEQAVSHLTTVYVHQRPQSLFSAALSL